jgi:uncharacterized protein YegP (UPF0339 family)
VKIEIFQRRTWKTMKLVKRWYFRVKGDNGEIMAQSEGYTTQHNALHAAITLKRDLSLASIVDVSR